MTETGHRLTLSRRGAIKGAAALAAAAALHAHPPARVAAQQATPVAGDPLPSWNEGENKRALLDFVAATTDPASPRFVPEPARVAVFDLDGTLWVERPAYVDLLFVEQRARDLVANDPALASQEPYKGLVALDDGQRAALSEEEVLGLVVDTFVGATPEEYHAFARQWLNTAVNPILGRRHVDCTYLPMLELLRYLGANGFRNAIASASDSDFLRVHSEPVFGIPRERAIGTTVQTAVAQDNALRLVRTDQTDISVWGDGKVIAIDRHLGRRPILAFGNADADLPMLEWTLAVEGERLAMLIHHDDDARAFAYDTAVNLKTPLAELRGRGIRVVSMRNDFRTVFPPLPGPNLDVPGNR